jgi:hypothetical protein
MTGMIPAFILHPEWYSEIRAKDVDDSKPGLYEWCIEGVGVYIGKYKHATRPRREYALNVCRLGNGLSYRKNKPKGFRRIHHELYSAIGKARITLTFLKNQSDEHIRTRREQELIAERKKAAENGGLPVLNST